jgi:hypothetical protein
MGTRKRTDRARPSPSRWIRSGLLLALSASAFSNCGILDEGGTPNSARVFIEGGSGLALALVTSNDFTIVSDDGGQTRDVYLNTQDSTTVSPPFDNRYSLGPAKRFYLRVGAEESLAQAVRVRVLVGGEKRFDGTSDLGDSDLEFVYSAR